MVHEGIQEWGYLFGVARILTLFEGQCRPGFLLEVSLSMLRSQWVMQKTFLLWQQRVLDLKM